MRKSVDLHKEIERHSKKEKRRKLSEQLVRLFIGYPIYFIFLKPHEYLKSKIHNIKNNYYQKRFKEVEKKALDEMKLYLSKELSGAFKSCVIFEEFNHEQPSGLCVEKFLSKNTLYYRRANRKYSRMYGELFPEELKENHLKYMNELVIWLLDQGCKINVGSAWLYNTKIHYLYAVTEEKAGVT